MIQRIKRLFARRPQETVIPPHSAPAPDYRINDGVDYSLPMVMSADMERKLKSAGQFEAYLREDARSSMRFQFDTPQRSAADDPIAPATDDPLMEWSEITRRRVLTNAHAAYRRNPLAKAAVDYTADFIIGNEGFQLNSQNSEVDKVLQAFIESQDNNLRAYERMAVADLQVDGELLLRMFTDDDSGEVSVQPMRPWELVEIETEDGFNNRKKSYKFRDAQGAESIILADEILHVAINRHAYEMRGRSELFAILPWLRAYKEWLEDRARQNYWRGALLWWVKVAAKLPGTVAAVLARWRKPPTPGSVVVTSDQEEVSAVTNSVGAADVAEDGRQIKLMIMSGIRLPEYFTGDGENANLATATAQQLPALTKFGAFQQIMENQLWRPLLKRVTQAAIDAGTLAETVTVQDSDGDAVLDANGQSKTVDTLDAFTVSYAPIVDADMLTVAQALAIANDRQWVSDETATTELGYNWDEEQKRLRQQQERDANDVRQGLKQPAPGVISQNGIAPDEQDEEQPEPEA